jgi:hypothetical protein
MPDFRTRTINDPRVGQSRGLQILGGISDVAKTGAGIYQDAQQAKLDEQRWELEQRWKTQQMETNRLTTGFGVLNEAIKLGVPALISRASMAGFKMLGLDDKDSNIAAAAFANQPGQSKLVWEKEIMPMIKNPKTSLAEKKTNLVGYGYMIDADMFKALQNVADEASLVDLADRYIGQFNQANNAATVKLTDLWKKGKMTDEKFLSAMRGLKTYGLEKEAEITSNAINKKPFTVSQEAKDAKVLVGAVINEAAGAPLSEKQVKALEGGKMLKEKHKADIAKIKAETKKAERGKEPKVLTPEEKAKKQADLQGVIVKMKESAAFIEQINPEKADETYEAISVLDKVYEDVYISKEPIVKSPPKKDPNLIYWESLSQKQKEMAWDQWTDEQKKQAKAIGIKF